MTPIPKATYEQELLTAARKVARLQVRRRTLRKAIKQVDADLRHERKMLRALANRDEDRRPDIAPSRLFGGATGLVRATGTDDAVPVCACRTDSGASSDCHLHSRPEEPR